MSAADWVQGAFGIVLTEFQQKATNLLCRAAGCGPYDMDSTFEKADWHFGRGVRFVVRCHHFATFDFSGLTRLVIGAHEDCVRVEIQPVNFSRIAIVMHPRKREGGTMESHPTIEQAIEHYREQS